MNPGSTLRIRLPIGSTLILALVLALGFALVGEFILRQPAVRDSLPAPTIGSANYDFEIRLNVVRRMAEDGGIDCVLLGSSIIENGINPLVLQEAYKEATGEDIVCVDLAVSGGGAYTQILLADILVEDYHPKLIFFEVTTFYLNYPRMSVLADLPWIQYRHGDFSIKGWLAEHSYLYRYAPLFTADDAFLDQRRASTRVLSAYHGHVPVNTFPLDPVVEEQIKANMSGWVDDNGRERLDQMLSFHNPPETQVVLLEVPLRPDVLEGEGRQENYDNFVAAVQDHIAGSGVLFLPGTGRFDFLDQNESWSNVDHLNTEGANLYSAWLGEQIGEAVNNGVLADPGAE